jgi:hypothetical protein
VKLFFSKKIYIENKSSFRNILRNGICRTLF